MTRNTINIRRARWWSFRYKSAFLHKIQLERWLLSRNYLTLKIISSFFKVSILFCFLKISISLKKTFIIVCSEIPCSKNSCHIETSQLIAWQINWTFPIWFDFLLRGSDTDFHYSHRNQLQYYTCSVIWPN